jgi:hypothetical protein
MAPPNQIAKLSTNVNGGSTPRAQETLSNSKIFGDSVPTNRTDYLPLFGVIFSLQDYLGGKGSYDLVKSKIKAWSQATNYSDSVNQAARANLIKVLEGVSDPDLKKAAASALTALKTNSKDVALASGSKDPATKDGASPSGYDQKPHTPLIAPSAGSKNLPKVASTDLKKWTEARDERKVKLSDSAIGWSDEKSKQYPRAGYAILTVRDFVAGRELQKDFVRKALLVWRQLPEFEKDPVLKQSYQNLMKALLPGSLSAEYNKEPASIISAVMKEVDTSVAKLGLSSPKVVASAPIAPVKAKQGPKEKDVPVPPVAAPLPAPVSTPVSVADLISDKAVFGDLVSTWNDPSVKNGKCLALNSALYALKDFLDGKSDYPKLKEKLTSWEGSACYKEALSYRARTNLISILNGVKSDSPLYSKAQSALLAFKMTKPIDPPKEPEPPAKSPTPADASKATPAVPVTYAELDVIPTAKAPTSGEATIDSFKTSRVKIAEREHSKLMAKSGKTFNFSGEVYVDIDPKGEISKVTYKKVNAVRSGETGDNVTISEVTELLKNIVNAYRGEVKFGKVEKSKLAFALNLTGVAAPAANPPAPPPATVVTPPDSSNPDPVKGSYSFSVLPGPKGLIVRMGGQCLGGDASLFRPFQGSL